MNNQLAMFSPSSYGEAVQQKRKHTSIQERAALVAQTVGFDNIRKYCAEAKAKFEAQRNGIVNKFFSMHPNQEQK